MPMSREIAVVCPELDTLRRIIKQLKQQDYVEPIASKKAEGLAQKLEGRDTRVVIVHESVKDSPPEQIPDELPPSMKTILLADQSRQNPDPFDKTLEYPIPGPVLRNAIDDLLEGGEPATDTAEWEKFRKGLTERLEKARAPSSTYYDILDIAQSADHDAITEAFDRLSNRYHPDQFRHLADGPLGDKGVAIKQKATDLYSLMTEAYEVLSNRTLRQKYREALDQGQTRLDKTEIDTSETGTPSMVSLGNKTQTKKFLRMAQSDLAHDNIESAIQNLEFARSVEPDNSKLQEQIEKLKDKRED